MMRTLGMVAGAPGTYITAGVLQISRTNFTIICVMVLVFVLALVVPFPTHDDQTDEQGHR